MDHFSGFAFRRFEFVSDFERRIFSLFPEILRALAPLRENNPLPSKAKSLAARQFRRVRAADVTLGHA
ncbi:MAG TPA: hypothetical protein VK200_04370, partial [Candidatus Limnocylindrales bacterium]|nr:hypothetical protein [Candidatus Limnocylindrales bacterium]